ncbi:peptidoglycan-binding protein [Streptomyces sp. NPDC058953]|uniref:L,D-transpeptidase family protein n=1 Tax=unclassified Streptomyces TaxID=2593676 RepID=UPI003684569A
MTGHTGYVHKALAAAAVVALTVSCSARATESPAGAVDAAADGKASGKASGGAAPYDDGLTVPPSSPAPSPSTEPPGPSASPSASPSDDASEPATTAPPAPVLMERGDSGKRVRELQARLAQLSWFDERPTGTYGRVTAAAVRGFQDKRGLPATGAVDTVTWDRLLGMTKRPTRDELDGRTAGTKPAAKLDPRCLNGRALCVSKTSRTLSWVVDGKVRSAMDVRFGGEETPTREGVFSVFRKERDHISNLYDTPMPYSLFFSGGQAVHYSADFAAQGYGGASHGCVNVRDRGAIAALFDQVRIGDKVVVHW